MNVSVAGLCNGMSKGHESDDAEQDQLDSDDSDAAQRRRRRNKKRERQGGEGTRAGQHEGRKSTASLPGWGETLSSMNWSLASQVACVSVCLCPIMSSVCVSTFERACQLSMWYTQKFKEETSKAKGEIQFKLAESLEKVVQSTQTLKKRAEDITENLTGRQRDSTMPLYRGDDDSD